ncbi:hypothetical protein ABZU32_11865 [Sphaerisporangium sp. NPDC005288]|uniref:hypothetical protein n=1 Tax=Sphaerisporangium sp. NPDC005288 TaxID=3155114 RepID=UPI0033A94F4F
MTSPSPARSVAVPTAEETRTAWRLVAAHLAPTPVDPGAGTAREPALKLDSLQPAEGAGAAAVAALIAGKVTPHGRMVAVVSGRDITLRALAAVLAQPHPGAP